MKIIVVGIGKLGEYLSHELALDNNEVTLIDINFNGKEKLINNEEVNYIEGNGLDSNILLEAGVQNSDLLISVMKGDAENVMCALTAKKLGVKNTIARIRTPEYSRTIGIIKNSLGLSMTINPEKITASQIAQTLSIPSAIESTSFLKGKMDVVSLKIKEKTKLNNVTVKEIANRMNEKIIICAIERNGDVIIPTGDTVLKNEDKIHITGTRKDINNFLKKAHLIQDKTKNVIITGGSDISIYLAEMLKDMHINVKIVEQNKERCEKLSQILDNVLVINGDPSNENILFEEGLKKCDAFVTLTNIDEENIVYSMFASINNVPKVITKINHINLSGIEDKACLDSVVTPHKIVSNEVLQYIRAIQNGKNSSCDVLYSFKDGIFEMAEFTVKEDFKGIDKKLKDLKFINDIIIGVIQRGKNIIYPSGKDEIKLGDRILIISKNKKIKELNEVVK